MMILGMVVFALSTLAYQELQRQTEWKHPSNSVVGGMNASQFTGQGDDTITLNGWIAPELTGTLYSLDVLRLMADTGKAWILIQGTGRILGNFVITNLKEGRTHFTIFGEAARVEFSITLKRVEVSEHNRLAILGDINSVRLDKLIGGV